MSHQELGTLADSYRTSFVIDAMTVFVIAIKAVKYFQLQRDLALLKGTLAQAIDTCVDTIRTMHVHARTLHAPCTHLARRFAQIHPKFIIFIEMKADCVISLENLCFG